MSEEKKFPATARKLREARKRGEVAKSKELTSFAAFTVVFLVLWLAAPHFIEHASSIIGRAIDIAEPPGPGLASTGLDKARAMAVDALWILLPLLIGGIVAACIVGVIQTRGLFSMEAITPKMERINPAAGLKNLFSLRQLFELGKLLVKLALLLGALGLIVFASLDVLVSAIYTPAEDVLRIAGHCALLLAGWSAVIYGVTSLIDYGHQKYEFMKRQRMTVEELRREQREEMGDPSVRASRRAVARSNAYGGLADRVASSNLVIANPTHVCVALYYMAGETLLPRVVAKGVDAMALRIRAVAESAGIPIIEDPPLARRVFSQVALDDYIHEQLIEAIAAAFRRAHRERQAKHR